MKQEGKVQRTLQLLAMDMIKQAMQIQKTFNVYCELFYYYVFNLSTGIHKSHFSECSTFQQSRVDFVAPQNPDQRVL